MICDKCEAEVSALIKVVTLRYQEDGRDIEESEEWCVKCVTGD